MSTFNAYPCSCTATALLLTGWVSFCAQGLLASQSAAVEAAELQKLVLKIFWSATYMGIPTLLLQEPQFVGWMTSLLQAVQQPMPQVRLAGSFDGV